MTFARKVWALYWKDLLAELRSKEVLNASFVFALLALVLFNVALDLRSELGRAAAPGVLWVVFAFAGILALGRAFAREHDRGTLEGILLAPLSSGALFLAKLLASATFMGLVELAALPLFVALFNIAVSWPALLLVTLLGTLGFAGVGTVLAAVAANTRAREVMLPILLLPLCLPVLIASVRATEQAIVGAERDSLPWVGLLVAFDAIFLTLSFLVFDFVVEA